MNAPRNAPGRVLGRGLKDLTAALPGSLNSLDSVITTAVNPRDRSVAPPNAAAQAPRVVVITSGKGGTGKSFLSVNLACGLAQQKQRVLLIDADFGLANAHLLLGINPKRDISHLLTGKWPVEDVLQTGPCDVRLLGGCAGISELSQLSFDQFCLFISEMLRVQQQYDWIIVDTSAGISPQVMSFLTAAKEVLLVVNAEATSMLDAYALLKTLFLRYPQAQVGCVANRVKDSLVAKEAYKKLNGAAEHYLKKSLLDTGHVVLDPSVWQSVTNRRPILLDEPRSDAAFCLKKIVDKMLDAQPKEKETSEDCYFLRLRKEVLYWQNGRHAARR